MLTISQEQKLMLYAILGCVCVWVFHGAAPAFVATIKVHVIDAVPRVPGNENTWDEQWASVHINPN